MRPKISVIVPVYKAEKYLHRCVDSILAQKFTDFELILVNDGSPDNSGVICDEYAQKDNRVRVFHKENGGVSSARNLGLKKANGEYVTFVDSDDHIEHGYLDIKEDFAEDLLIQNYIVSQTKKTFVNFEKRTVNECNIQNYINENIDADVIRLILSKFFKLSIIKDNQIYFQEGVKIGEDTIFILDYLYYTKSVRYMASASYIYEDPENRVDKYRLNAEKAVETFHLFIERYNKLNADSITFLHFVFMFYWSLISPKDYNSIRRWKSDRIVKQTFQTIRHRLSKIWRIKYYFLPLYTILRKRHAS